MPIRVVPDPPGIYLDEVEPYPNGKPGDTRLMTETQHKLYQLEIQLEGARANVRAAHEENKRLRNENMQLKGGSACLT